MPQQLKNVTLSAIALVDDPAVPKAYFRVVKRNLDTPTEVIKDEVIPDVVKDAQSALPQGTEVMIDLTEVNQVVETIGKKVDDFISQTSITITELQSQIASLQQSKPEIQPTVGDNEWVDTLTYLQSSYQSGEIDDVAYDTLLGELELGLSQLT